MSKKDDKKYAVYRFPFAAVLVVAELYLLVIAIRNFSGIIEIVLSLAIIILIIVTLALEFSKKPYRIQVKIG